MSGEMPQADEFVEVSLKENFLIARDNRIVPLNEVLYPESYKHSMPDDYRRMMLSDFLNGESGLVEGVLEDEKTGEGIAPFLDYQTILKGIAPRGLLSLVLGRVVEQSPELTLEAVSPTKKEYGFGVALSINRDHIRSISRYVEQTRHTTISPQLFQKGAVVSLHFHPDSVATRDRDTEFVIRAYDDAINPFANLPSTQGYERDTHIAIFDAFLRADQKAIYPQEALDIAGQRGVQLVWQMGVARPKGYSDKGCGRVVDTDDEAVILSNISLNKKENQNILYTVNLSAIKEAILYKVT